MGSSAMPAQSGDPISSALHLSLSSGKKCKENIDSKLCASAKNILLSEVKYESSKCFNTNKLSELKDKYIVLETYSSVNNNVNNLKSDEVTETKVNDASDTTVDEPVITNELINLPTPKRVLYSPDAVRLGWSGNVPVGSGFINVGNTCYLNSSLQALFHVPAFVNWLLHDKNHSVKCESLNGMTHSECLICAMARTCQASHNSTGSVIRPEQIYSKLRLICRHLVQGHQEDAHEFLRYLIEGMERSYLTIFNGLKLDSYSKETTPLNQIFGGYLRSEVACLECQSVSTTFQHFQDLLLDIRTASSVDEALNCFFLRERLGDGDQAYRCETCKRRVAATKKFTLERAPKALCIAFKRFGAMGGKNNKLISLKPTLDISKFRTRQSPEPLLYKLVSMVTHLGPSASSGHYTAIGLTSTGSYYMFDDSSVRPIPLQNVLNNNPYILMYERDIGTKKQLPGKKEAMTNGFIKGHNGNTDLKSETKLQLKQEASSSNSCSKTYSSPLSQAVNSNKPFRPVVSVNEFNNKKFSSPSTSSEIKTYENGIAAKNKQPSAKAHFNQVRTEASSFSARLSSFEEEVDKKEDSPSQAIDQSQTQLPDSPLIERKESKEENDLGTLTQTTRHRPFKLGAKPISNLPPLSLSSKASSLDSVKKKSLFDEGKEDPSKSQISKKQFRIVNNMKTPVENSSLDTSPPITLRATKWHTNEEFKKKDISESCASLPASSSSQAVNSHQRVDIVSSSSTSRPSLDVEDSAREEQEKKNKLSALYCSNGEDTVDSTSKDKGSTEPSRSGPLHSSPNKVQNSVLSQIGKYVQSRTNNLSLPNTPEKSEEREQAEEAKSSPSLSLVPYGSDGSSESEGEFIQPKSSPIKDPMAKSSDRPGPLLNSLRIEEGRLEPSGGLQGHNRPDLHSPAGSTSSGKWSITSAEKERSPERALKSSRPSTPVERHDHRKTNGSSMGFIKNDRWDSSQSNGNGSTHDHLMKTSHWGYGSQVNSWNGGKSEMDLEVEREKGFGKRSYDSYNDEYDRGKIKKHKKHHMKEYMGNGRNRFQEMQNRKNSWHGNPRPKYYHYSDRKPKYFYNRNGWN